MVLDRVTGRDGADIHSKNERPGHPDSPSWNKILRIWMIYALLTRNYAVKIYTLFPQFFWGRKVESANFFTFRMYGCRLLFDPTEIHRALGWDIGVLQGVICWHRQIPEIHSARWQPSCCKPMIHLPPLAIFVKSSSTLIGYISATFDFCKIMNLANFGGLDTKCRCICCCFVFCVFQISFLQWSPIFVESSLVH